MSVAGLLASIQHNMVGTTPVQVQAADEGLGIQLDFEMEHDPMDIGA
jgi:hypothetical protein